MLALPFQLAGSLIGTVIGLALRFLVLNPLGAFKAYLVGHLEWLSFVGRVLMHLIKR